MNMAWQVFWWWWEPGTRVLERQLKQQQDLLIELQHQMIQLMCQHSVPIDPTQEPNYVVVSRNALDDTPNGK